MISFIEWFGFASIILLGAASPGPDLIVVLRNAVLHSSRAGIFTALGIGAGLIIHITYSLLGITALIASSITLFTIIKYIGAAYLVYIGVKSLRSKGYENTPIIQDNDLCNRPHIPALKAFAQGFLTNLLNPKAMLFFLALLPQFISPDADIFKQIIIASTAITLPTIWFIGVSAVLNHRHIRRTFLRFAKWIDRLCGGLLIALGVKLALIKA